MSLKFQFGITESVLRFPTLLPALPLIAGTGATWLRADMPWSNIDPTLGNGTYPSGYSASASAQISSLQSLCSTQGMNLLVAVTVPASGGGDFPIHTSTVASYGAMMAWLVGECPGLHWEILNEPDNGGTSASVYTQLCQASYGPMKSADPTCTVIGGVLSRIDSTGQTYWQSCYTDGILGSYDVVSVHCYSARLSSYPVNFDPGSIMTPLVQQFQALMALNADGSPLWMTEFGWDSFTSDTDSVTTLQQSQFVCQWLADCETLGMPVVMLFNGTDGNPPNYGVLDTGFHPKPIYSALRVMTGKAVPNGLA